MSKCGPASEEEEEEDLGTVHMDKQSDGDADVVSEVQVAGRGVQQARLIGR